MAKAAITIMITVWVCFTFLITPVDSPNRPPTATRIAERPSPTATRLIYTVTPFVPSATPTLTPTLTHTPSPTPTASETPTLTATATATASVTPSLTPSPLPTTLPPTPSEPTQEPSVSASPGFTSTATPSPTLTPSPTVTYTATPTNTPTATPSPTLTTSPSATYTATPTNTTTNTPSLTPTPTNTLFIESPSKLPTATAVSPTPTPVRPTQINGLELSSIIVMNDAVRAHVKDVYACGVARGNNPRAFSRIGDCNSEPPHFLYRFDDGPYNLGVFDYVQPMIDFFKGSFRREGVAVQRGFRTWSMLDPMWADKSKCKGGESVLDCELRLNRPSVMIVRLGTNDNNDPEYFERSLRQIIYIALKHGTIPILGTKADQLDGPTNPINNMVRRLAAEYQLPLWDFELAAMTLPGRGLESDLFHMTTYFAHDWRSPLGFQTGHGLQNITGLLALYAVWEQITAGDPVICSGLPE